MAFCSQKLELTYQWVGCYLLSTSKCGGVAEWSKAAVLKTVRRKSRGFESYLLRFFRYPDYMIRQIQGHFQACETETQILTGNHRKNKDRNTQNRQSQKQYVLSRFKGRSGNRFATTRGQSKDISSIRLEEWIISWALWLSQTQSLQRRPFHNTALFWFNVWCRRTGLYGRRRIHCDGNSCISIKIFGVEQNDRCYLKARIPKLHDKLIEPQESVMTTGRKHNYFAVHCSGISSPALLIRLIVITLVRRIVFRRGRDSNPRSPWGLNGFRDRPIQPLWHLSICLLLKRHTVYPQRIPEAS